MIVLPAPARATVLEEGCPVANVMSPIVSERIWALPLSGAAVKFFQYLVARSDFGGALPVRRKDMAAEYGAPRPSAA